MEGVDKEKVQRIVYEMSKGSKYFENEERKEVIIREKIEKMRARCMQLTATDLSQYQKVYSIKIMSCCIFIYLSLDYMWGFCPVKSCIFGAQY